VVDGNKLIGIAIYGGNGSPAGYNNSGGTLYELTWTTFRNEVNVDPKDCLKRGRRSH